MAYTLTLKSQSIDMRVIAGVATPVMLYRAYCSCGTWRALNVTASEAREQYDIHMQRVAGPEAQIAREATS